MKVEIYLTSLENNLTNAITARKEFKSLQDDGNNLMERITFLQLNDWRN